MNPKELLSVLNESYEITPSLDLLLEASNQTSSTKIKCLPDLNTYYELTQINTALVVKSFWGHHDFCDSNATSIESEQQKHSMPTNEISKIQQLQIMIQNKISTFRNLHRTLDSLDEACKEEGFEVFSEKAQENAQKVLNAVYERFPDYEYYIYPTEDREIAIDCNPQKGKGILILCDSNGSVAYFSTLDGKNSRFRCDNIEDFPYELLWKAFVEFNKEEKYSSKDITKKPSSVFISDTYSPSIKMPNAIYNSPKGIEYIYA